MTTHTCKFTAGQTAWLILNNKVVSDIVGSVTVRDVWNAEQKTRQIAIFCGFRSYNFKEMFESWTEVDEKLCFPTKEELLASL